MTLNEIPFETTCHGDFAEFETSKGTWLRVRSEGDKFVVTQFGADKQQTHEPAEMTRKQLAALL